MQSWVIFLGNILQSTPRLGDKAKLKGITRQQGNRATGQQGGGFVGHNFGSIR